MDKRIVGDELDRVETELRSIGTRVLCWELEPPLLYVELVTVWISLGLLLDQVSAGFVSAHLDMLAARSLEPETEV
jgi:hypothetical protein